MRYTLRIMMKRSEIRFGLLRLPLDLLLTALALLLAYRLRTMNMDLVPWVQLLEPAATLPPAHAYLRSFVLPATGMFIAAAGMLKLYALKNTLGAWNELGRIFLSALLWLVAVMAWFFLFRRQLFFSRVLLVHATVLVALFVAAGRMLIVLVQRRMLQRGIGVRAVVSVGKRKLAAGVHDVLARDPHYAYRGHRVDLARLRMTEASALPDLVLHTDPDPDSDATMELIDYCRSHHVEYAFFPPVFADVPHQLAVERLGLLPMLRFRPTPLDGWGRVCKRLTDTVIALILILLLIPVFLCIAIAVLLDGGWPIFYVSRRVSGAGEGKTIGVLKFRSMIRNADERKQELQELNHRRDGPLFKVKNDPRVTRTGAVLRRWSLDELPQLFNVLAGHLSLVGPRPHLPEEVARYTEYQRRVFAVRPGMTGLAQISGRSDLTFDEEVGLDLKYIQEWSLLLDCWILWRTLVVVAGRKGAD